MLRDVTAITCACTSLSRTWNVWNRYLIAILADLRCLVRKNSSFLQLSKVLFSSCKLLKLSHSYFPPRDCLRSPFLPLCLPLTFFQISLRKTPCTRACVLPQSRVHLFNPFLFLHSSHVVNCRRFCKNGGHSLLANSAGVTTTQNSYIYLFVPPQRTKSSDRFPVARSMCVKSNVQVAKTLVTPAFRYVSAEILTGLCLIDAQVLVNEVLSIFQSSNFDLEILRRFLTTRKTWLSPFVKAEIGDFESF